MEKMLFIVVLLLVTPLSHAKTPNKEWDGSPQPICFKSLTASLSRGMDRADVKKLLGRATQTSASNGRELWAYEQGNEQIVLEFAFLRDINTKKMSFVLDSWYSKGRCSLNKYKRQK